MKKRLAFLLCFMMTFSLASCILEPAATRDTAANTITTNLPTESGESTTNTSPVSNEIAMEMYEAAIKGEICVIDERLGEIKLKACRVPSNNVRIDECNFLTKSILDLDGDGVDEFVIKSSDYDHIILRYYNGKVYSYGFYINQLNTDGTFYWSDSSVTGDWSVGLNKIISEGETLITKNIYRLKFSKNPTQYEYFIEGKVVTSDEYYDYRAHHYPKESMKFSQFELTSPYLITAEEAWDLANEYWDHQDGIGEGGAGTIWIAHIALIDKPNSETNDYRFAFQVKWYSGGGQDGYECMTPYDIQIKDEILVDAFTREITTPACEAGNKCISVEEAIEAAKNHRTYMSGHICNEENGYRVEHVPHATAPAHYYVIMIQKYDTVTDVIWIDKYTGKAISPYYMYGKG
jgi:hypothetical protein